MLHVTPSTSNNSNLKLQGSVKRVSVYQKEAFRLFEEALKIDLPISNSYRLHMLLDSARFF